MVPGASSQRDHPLNFDTAVFCPSGLLFQTLRALVELAQIGAPKLTILDRVTLTVRLDRADRVQGLFKLLFYALCHTPKLREATFPGESILVSLKPTCALLVNVHFRRGVLSFHGSIDDYVEGNVLRANEIRSWLGAYVLFLAAFLGGYLIIAPDSVLPLENNDRTACFEIMLPFLLGQIAAVYRFYTDPRADERDVGSALPTWAVKSPLIIVTILIAIQLGQFAFAGITRGVPPAPETFKGLVTFCVALLNASTVLIIVRYFDTPQQKRGTRPSKEH
ncbi:hypothetical protein [Bradyrhizobium sp. STM 3557]|uniref:hypothetical protein n=1 Tax=Bradyrhizobium sp. STM 3557 TaxID=578920 RepID=UPI00388DCF80